MSYAGTALEPVGDALGLSYTHLATLTEGRYLKVCVANTDDLDEMAAALTARRDELALIDARFQVPVIMQTPDPEFTFRTVWHEWKEMPKAEMKRRGWNPLLIAVAALAQ